MIRYQSLGIYWIVFGRSHGQPVQIRLANKVQHQPSRSLRSVALPIHRIRCRASSKRRQWPIWMLFSCPRRRKPPRQYSNLTLSSPRIWFAFLDIFNTTDSTIAGLSRDQSLRTPKQLDNYQHRLPTIPSTSPTHITTPYASLRHSSLVSFPFDSALRAHTFPFHSTSFLRLPSPEAIRCSLISQSASRTVSSWEPGTVPIRVLSI